MSDDPNDTRIKNNSGEEGEGGLNVPKLALGARRGAVTTNMKFSVRIMKYDNKVMT